MEFKNYLDGAGQVDISPPRREYRIDPDRTQEIIAARMYREGISMEEAFARELEALKRKHREIRIGQMGMTILVSAGMATTGWLASHGFSDVAVLPFLLSFASLTLAQIRYRRRVIADPYL